MKINLTPAFVLVSVSLCCAQQPVSNFTLTDVTGKSVSLDSYSSARGLVVIFTSNECAFNNYYTSRIKSLAGVYDGKIQFVLINALVEPEESIEKMAAKYKDWGFEIPYLADKEQSAMEVLGAKKCPEAFLLSNVGGKYFVVYQGALDDNPQMAEAVKQNYLKTSIDQLLANQKIEIPMMRAIGCSIKKK